MKRTTIFLIALCVLCGLLSWRAVVSRAAVPGTEQPRSAAHQVAGASGVTPSANRMPGAAACDVPNSFTVTVLYNFTGFFKSLVNSPVANVMDAGQVVLVKFFLSGNKSINIFAAGFPTSSAIACNSTSGDSRS